MWTALVCINVSVCALSFCPWVHVCVCVGQCVQWVGQVRLACQRLEHLWHSCHPRSPSSAPKQGNWEGGGQAHRAVPKLSLFITATEMGRGRQGARPLLLTYCDHLLLHSVSVWAGGCASLRIRKEEKYKALVYLPNHRSVCFIFDLWSFLLWLISAWKKCVCESISPLDMSTYLRILRKSASGAKVERCCGSFLTQCLAVVSSTLLLHTAISRKRKTL